MTAPRLSSIHSRWNTPRLVPIGTPWTTADNLSDLMGFGFSEKPQDRSYSIETYVTQLGTFLDRLNLEDPILGGQGIGALITL